MSNAPRIFMGLFPTGIVYADRQHEVAGDYARLAFLSYRTLVPEFVATCPPDLRAEITADMATIQARRGEDFQITTSGQTVRLGP